MTSGTTWARVLHLVLAAWVAAACAMVWPGLVDMSLRTIAGLYLAPLPLLAVLACVPAVRRSEGIQARALVLRGPAGDAVSLEPARRWPERGRVFLWLCVRVGLGVLAGQLTALALGTAWSLLPVSGRDAGWALTGVPFLLLALVYVLAALGALTAAAARGLLGPTAGERLAAEAARAARRLERTRLAAELHDSIGHALTVTLLQAEAAREVAGRDPAFVAAALSAIEDSARQATADLERVLGLLREPSAIPAGAPGLAEVGRLVRSAEAAGARVDLAVSGPVGDLPPAVSHEGHRIVQEALTNALRHAGPGPVRVRIDVGREHLALLVSNPVPVAPVPAAAGSGSGVRGLRERAALLGGSAEAGPVEDRWQVDVRLPLRGTA